MIASEGGCGEDQEHTALGGIGRDIGGRGFNVCTADHGNATSSGQANQSSLLRVNLSHCTGCKCLDAGIPAVISDSRQVKGTSDGLQDEPP